MERGHCPLDNRQFEIIFIKNRKSQQQRLTFSSSVRVKYSHLCSLRNTYARAWFNLFHSIDHHRLARVNMYESRFRLQFVWFEMKSKYKNDNSVFPPDTLKEMFGVYSAMALWQGWSGREPQFFFFFISDAFQVAACQRWMKRYFTKNGKKNWKKNSEIKFTQNWMVSARLQTLRGRAEKTRNEIKRILKICGRWNSPMFNVYIDLCRMHRPCGNVIHIYDSIFNGVNVDMDM